MSLVATLLFSVLIVACGLFGFATSRLLFSPDATSSLTEQMRAELDTWQHDAVHPPEGPSPGSQLLLRLLPSGQHVATYRQEMHERRQARVDRLRTSLEADLSLEELVEAAINDERLSEMIQIAVQAASSSTSGQKIDLLAKVLSQAAQATDSARVDESALYMRLVDDLEPPDLRALVLFTTPDGPRGLPAVQSPVSFVADSLNLSVGAAETIVARLERLGLLRVHRRADVVGVDEDDRYLDDIEVEETYSATAAAKEILALIRP